MTLRALCAALLIAGAAGAEERRMGGLSGTRLASRGARAAVLIEGMNRIPRRAPADRAANLAAHARPVLPLAPGLAETLARFIAALP